MWNWKKQIKSLSQLIRNVLMQCRGLQDIVKEEGIKPEGGGLKKAWNKWFMSWKKFSWSYSSRIDSKVCWNHESLSIHMNIKMSTHLSSNWVTEFDCLWKYWIEYKNVLPLMPLSQIAGLYLTMEECGEKTDKILRIKQEWIWTKHFKNSN